MKSKILKRSIAIMLCMVIVLSGSGYLLAETFEEGNAEVMEASVTDVPAEDATVQEETAEAGNDATVEVEIPAQQEEPSTPAAEAPAAETPAAEAPAAETPAAEGAEPIQQLTYEDDDVKVIVDATKAGNIPDGATLSVTPLEKREITAGMSAEEKAKIEEVNAQYDLTETKLQEKAENEEYDIAGFLAYDITFVDADGNKLEPNGDVKVSMEYKKAVVPEEVKQAEAEAKANNDEYKADVTVMHLEENSNGTVKEVVDMVADKNEVATVDTTTTSKVKKAEFVTDSFSTYTVTWTVKNRKVQLTAHYGYEDNNGQFIEFTDLATEQIPQVREDDWVYLDDYANTDIFEKDNYTYTKAYISTSNEYNSKSECYSLRIKEHDDDYYLQKKANKDAKRTNVGEAIVQGATRYIDVYYVYISTGSSGGSGGSGGSGNISQNTLDAPEHNKVIKYNSDTKDYTLTLDVTGKKGATVGADVLLVIDNSGSMGLNSSEKIDSNHFNLMPSLKKIVKETVVPKLLPDDESVNSIAAVSFSSYSSSGISTSWTGYSGRQNIIQQVNSLTPNGATNWQWAMRRAESKLGEKATSVNKKYVIFLSDGEPTKYFDNYGSEKGAGNSFEQNGLDYAVNEVTKSSYLKGATIYSVYLTSGTQSRMTEFATKLKNQGVDARAVDGTKMSTSIDSILNEITTPAYTDVVIEDTLSQYVDFAEENPQFTVQYTKDGKTQKLASDQYTVTQSGKKITLNLSNVGELDADTTYSISFKVKPSQTAIDYYKERSSYPHIGDAETDAPDNTTSSNRPGFYSNDTATVSYKVNGSQGDFSAEYKKPVVQVDASSIGPVTPALSEPEHKKTIYQNGKDDYTLSLDVKGAVGEATPIDVLLIIDESSSMDSTRRTNVKNAVKTLGEKLMQSEAKENIQIAAVTFSGTKTDRNEKAYDDAFLKMNWTKLTDFDYENFNLTVRNGTNWQAGVKKGEEILTLGRKKASKYVIFLTDGAPTFYYDDSGMTAGKGGSYDQNAYNAAVTEWENSSNMYAAGKYIVDATSSGNNKNCQDFATAVGAQVLNAKDNFNMTAAFKKIADDITKPEYTNVYIQDQLSEYVDFQDRPNLHVYADGEELSSNQYTYTLDKATKTIRVNLLNGAALTKDAVYTIKFDVKPTEKAYFEYETNGTYNSVGDLNTDTNPKEKITSSDKLGFHSNNKAYVGYDVGISQGLTTDYDHPVVQVEPETVNHSVEKRWVRGSEAFVNVKLIAQYNVGTVDDPDIQMIDPTAYKALPQGTGMTQLLNGDNNWKYEWKNLPKYYYYTDENGVIQKTEILYSVEEVNPSEDYEVSYDAIENGTIITNTSKKEWKIIKQSDSVSPDRIPIVLEGAVFELRSNSADGKTYKGVSGADGIVTWVEVVQKESGEKEEIPVTAIAQDEYTLEEKNAPAGYSVSGKLWTVDYTIGSIPNIFDQDGEVVSPESEDGKVYTYVFENTPLYALPSAGGPGIFWYTIGGILLMMAAALILYKNKCREVLNR